ncbi:Carboxylate/amino acid/amine transporter family protein [Spironucleus salmonicida]|uniref:Carboxylate/amino acid/amine transporter family protein n=1 Tax=Spironucleus salmonicida TaxID=348837 RepID=S5U481_9EUKA|nr:carboxylate/amino acid/amine transporter family protein [Spironucleus salmonicida]KAH0576438.1 Carboxylate/amino acid/amine transporter family protein [Spironucleus salmonicida]|eukprot:EST45833.1 Carboxylate/amino acid/amine transporter family protein [Spironucleus salmonicida]
MKLLAPVLGLCLALLNAFLGTFLNASNAFYQTNLPAFTAFIYYFLCSLLIFKVPKKAFFQIHKRILCGVVDICANLCVIYAYAYTSVASALLIVSLSTPLSVVFYFLIQKKKISIYKIVFSVITVAFAAGFAGTDFKGSQWQGLLLSAGAALCYGLACVINEKYSADIEYSVFLGQMSLIGAVVTFAMSMGLEVSQFQDIPFQAWLLISAFGIGMVGFYFLSLVIYRISSAVFFSVSLVLTNVFTFPISILLFKDSFQWWQYMCAGGVILSIIGFIWAQEKRFKQEKQTRELIEGGFQVAKDIQMTDADQNIIPHQTSE